MAWPEINPAGRTLGPSAIAPKQENPITGTPYSLPDAMSRFDIEHVINGFVETAKGAVAAGFDGIEIHGAHGYLINQFLSYYSNLREDDYGGSIENRFRFARETIQAVRAVVPDDHLLLFRLSNWGIADMEVSLFRDAEEWQTVIRLLAAEPIDVISVSTYNFSEKVFNTGKTMAQLSREATTLPLMICGQIHDRESVELALQHADIVLSAKSILLNQDWIEDVRSGKTLPLHKSDEANVAYTTEPLI
jgi:2,4-dienoyl-CoA reductase-like NADH-dependent reductase (Old Yellow Enzyme family)